jgi:hypothetical protein
LITERWPNVKLSIASISLERERLGFHWRPPLHKQEVSIPQQFQRLQWCVDLRAMGLDPSKFVFSDESRFVLGDDHRWRHLRRGEWNETAFATHVKFPASVMIWGAIGANYKSGCVFCSNGVDQAEYQRIIESTTLVADMNARFGEMGWYFMQDGASCHTAKKTMEFLQPLCLILPGWLPNSPDLNPIEIIWAIMKW